MKTVLLSISFILILSTGFAANTDNGGGKKSVAVKNTPAKTKAVKGQKIIMCQVLEVKDGDQTATMAVFAEITVDNSSKEAITRNSQLIKKERSYLGHMFFADVDVVEDVTVVEDVASHMKLLKEKYNGIKLWSVLSADQIKK
jgi:hypothetical protein